MGKKSRKKTGGSKKTKRRTEEKAAKRAAAAAKQARKDQKAAAKQAKAAGPVPAAPDPVEVLKLALRDTEAKLVDAEHRLRQVQQQLDDERRALAEAAEEAAAEAVVDAAVAETVVEAVVDAELAAAEQGPAAVAGLVAEELDEVASLADTAEPEPDHAWEAEEAAAAFTDSTPPAEALTPPLPEEPAPDAPSEEWTLVRLREEARRRGLTGVSNLPKAQLVERLGQG